MWTLIFVVFNVDVGEGNRCQVAGPGAPEGDPGSDCIAYVFVFPDSNIIFQQYKLPLSDQAPSNSDPFNV